MGQQFVSLYSKKRIQAGMHFFHLFLLQFTRENFIVLK